MSSSYRERDRDRDGDRHRDSHRSGRDERDEYRSRDKDRRRSRSPTSSRRRHEDEDDSRKRRKHESGSSKRETSKERAERKAAKRAQKSADAAATAEARLAAAEVSFYSATDNPFNDANLGDKFVWGKKKEKERKSGMSIEEARSKDADRRREAEEELAKLNQRRAEREREMELREEEAMRAQQLAEGALMAEWIAKEDDFHLEQSKKRAEIRIKERRAKAIDYLAINLKWSQPPSARDEKGKNIHEEEDDGAGLEVDLEEPYIIFDNLTIEEANELHQDIKMYLSLESIPFNQEFWRALLICSSAALERLESNSYGGSTGKGVTPQVASEIQRLLSGKTVEQLNGLQTQVKAKLSSQQGDADYWNHLLKELVVFRAKAKLREMHETVLRNRLEQLRQKQRDEAIRFEEELKASKTAPVAVKAEDDGEEGNMELEEDEAAEPEQQQRAWREELEPALMKTVPEHFKVYELVDPVEELAKLITQRQAVAATRFVTKPSVKSLGDGLDDDGLGGSLAKKTKDEEIYQAALGQGLDEEEELFNLEVELEAQGKTYTWEDKYRPRKPRYFNKVHTGYEWNKYNQTHYDTDNPPPKVVQGYKFNIFYPDLIDKTKAPVYKIIKQKGNDDTCTLLFTAGPPYEDIAFTIVNKEWEHSHKRGFRSSFDRGVLQLHFTVRRQWYRR